MTELSAGLGGASDNGGGILQAGIGSSLKLGEHQSFNLNLSLIDAARPGYTDFQLGAGYGYQF